ncbi:DMT family transporter [Flavobacterium psychrotrophum]|uniref:DMT family transporter n=1 Tax=Flavobacterium psychrotrophum TaxID=2294119 RepID=UPI000E3238FC|nr:DMT family transporter [Flavobacterium psychrotrophum]
MQGDNLKNYLHLHLIVFVWGFTAVLGKLITLGAFPLVWFRMSIAVALMAIYGIIMKVPFKVSLKAFIQFMLAGLIIALHWFTFFHAIKISNISVTLACLSTGAFFASLLEPLLYGRKIIAYEVIFGLFVIAGLYIIFHFEGNYLFGILTALLSAFLSTLFAIINGKFAKQHNATAISFYELLGGIFFFSLYLLYSGEFTPEFFTLSASDWLWLFILGSVCTAYAQIAAVKVMQTITPYTMMLTINLEPIYGIILALVVFEESERMASSFYVGAAIILITVIINGVLKNRLSKAN